MANNQGNNNQRGRQNRNLPVVSVPQGVDDDVLGLYVNQFGGRMRFQRANGKANVHAVDALRRNVWEVLLSDGRKARALSTRLSGQVYLVSPSTRQIAQLAHIAHVLAPVVMAEDADRVAAIAHAVNRGSLTAITSWNRDPAQTTYCSHTWEECTCHEVRGDTAPRAFLYAAVDVVPHVAPADVARIVRRAGCSGIISTQRVFAYDADTLEENGTTYVITQVPGTGAFREHDYRGLQEGGLFDFEPPTRALVMTGICEMSPDKLGMAVYLSATTAEHGRVVRTLGDGIVTSAFKTAGGDAVAVKDLGSGKKRVSIVTSDGEQSVTVSDGALALARAVPVPTQRSSVGNNMAHLKLQLRSAGHKHSDAEVAVLYAYGVLNTARGGVHADDIMQAALGVKVLPDGIQSHLDAYAPDRELVDIYARAQRLAPTRRESANGTGPTGGCLIALAALCGGAAAARRRMSSIAYALSAIAAVAASQGYWQQFVRDASALVRRVWPALFACIAVTSVWAVTRFNAAAASLTGAYRNYSQFVADAYEKIDVQKEMQKTALGAEVAAVVTRYQYAGAAVSVLSAPFYEEWIKHRTSYGAAAGVAMGTLESWLIAEPPLGAILRIGAHAAWGRLDQRSAIAHHFVHNLVALGIDWLPAAYRAPAALAIKLAAIAATFVHKPLAHGYMSDDGLAVIDPISKRYLCRDLLLEDVPKHERASGVALAAVCQARDFTMPAPPVIAGNNRGCKYSPHRACSPAPGGWYCGGVAGFDIGYAAQCVHNAYAGAVVRLLLQRPPGVEDDERAIARAFDNLLQREWVLLDKAQAHEAAASMAEDREGYIASLKTAALRAEAEQVQALVAMDPGIHVSRDKLKYLVKIEKKLISSPDMRESGGEPKTDRAIIPPQLHGKSFNAYNHAAEKLFFEYTSARVNYRVIKYDGSAEDAAQIMVEAYESAPAVQGIIGDAAYIVRVDVKKCDASQGPAACAFHRVQLQWLGVIDDRAPPSLGRDATDDCYDVLRRHYSANMSDDPLLSERSLNQLMFVRPTVVYDEQFRCSYAGKMPSGVAYTSGGTTRMITAIQGLALFEGMQALGATDTEALACVRRTVRVARGDDNFMFVRMGARHHAIFAASITATFARFGLPIEINIAAMVDLSPLVPICSHLMYPCLANTPDDDAQPVLPAPRIGRILSRALVLARTIPKTRIRNAVYSAAVDLLHTAGHVRLVRLFAERIIDTCGTTKPFELYDRDREHNVRPVYPAVGRADDAACRHFIVEYYAVSGGVERSTVAMWYDEACAMMATFEYGDCIDNDFARLACRVDYA